MTTINLNELREYLSAKELTFEEFFYLKNIPNDDNFNKSLSTLRDKFNNIIKTTKKIKKACYEDNFSDIIDNNNNIKEISEESDDYLDVIENYVKDLLFSYNELRVLLLHIITKNEIDFSIHTDMSKDELTALRRISTIRNLIK